MSARNPITLSDASPPPCPECRATATALVDSVATTELALLYRRHGIDTAPWFDGVPAIARFRCAVCDLRFFSPACAGGDRFYEQLQRFDWYYQDAKPEYHYARQYIHDTQRVLEVGCGKGAFRAFLPESVDYTGLEFNDDAVDKATIAGLNVRKEPVEAHATRHPAGYDIVCSFQVLEHVPHPATFLDACVAALADGGLLIIAVPAEDSFLSVAVNAPLNMPPHHALRWTDRALASMAARRGLSPVALWHEPVADFHRAWQAHTLAHRYLVEKGLGSTRLIDTRLRYRALTRLIRNRKVRGHFAQKALDMHPVLGHGHTVVLVAKKN